MLSRSRVIAKGRRIREVERLVAQYGGKASKWCERAAHNSRLREIDIPITPPKV
jgi:hypothetical protein